MTIQKAHIGRVRLTRRGMRPIYRICRMCGETWNVSAVEPGDKHYICPICAKKRRPEEATPWAASLKIWELQVLHLREKILPGIADIDGSYELIKLGEKQYPAESTTILYDEMRCTLYMQRNVYGTSIRNIEIFLCELSPQNTSIVLKPVIKGNQLNKINSSSLYRKFILVADTEQLGEEHKDTLLYKIVGIGILSSYVVSVITTGYYLLHIIGLNPNQGAIEIDNSPATPDGTYRIQQTHESDL